MTSDFLACNQLKVYQDQARNQVDALCFLVGSAYYQVKKLMNSACHFPFLLSLYSFQHLLLFSRNPIKVSLNFSFVLQSFVQILETVITGFQLADLYHYRP